MIFIERRQYQGDGKRMSKLRPGAVDFRVHHLSDKRSLLLFYFNYVFKRKKRIVVNCHRLVGFSGDHTG